MLAIATASTLALAQCGTTGAPTTSGIHAEPIPLVEKAADRRNVGRLRFLAGFELTGEGARLGGLSDLRVDPDGGRLLAISDRGAFWRARLTHDPATRRLTGLDDWTGGDIEGRPEDIEAGDDSESVTRLGEHGLVVGYEGDPRLRFFPTGNLTTGPEALNAPAELADAPVNASLETLATLADGSLVLIAEGLTREDGAHQGWLRRPDGRLESFGYLAGEGFDPTAADQLGDWVYVLERRLSVFDWFSARIVRVPVTALASGTQVEGEALARLERPLAVDNMEGIAVRTGPAGSVLIYLVSDDNFLPFQRTLLLQFALAD